MNVMILEDDRNLAETLSDLLERDGHQPMVAHTVDAARSRLADLPRLDATAIDMNLPDGNAIDFLRFVRDRFPDVRIVVMTGGGTVSADIGIPLARAHGAHDVLYKPFGPKRFLSAIVPSGTDPVDGPDPG